MSASNIPRNWLASICCSASVGSDEGDLRFLVHSLGMKSAAEAGSVGRAMLKFTMQLVI
jgi:hypothetical protein